MKGLRCFLLLSLLSLTACDKDAVLPNTLTEQVKADLDAAADRVFFETSTPGLLALVAVDGEPDHIITRGTSNLLTNAPMDSHDAFRIASITKTFTGTAILMLVDQGHLALDQSIEHYLPEYAIPSGDEITVRMLGNMTSGLFDYSFDPEMGELFEASGHTLYFTPDSLLTFSFRHPLNFTPGTAYEYSNTNTLGLLIEKITGKPAHQAIQEMVTGPLDLRSTYFGGAFFMNTPYTHGYTLGDAGLLDATNWNTSWGYTAGAMISDLNDMKKWARCLADGDLLSATMRSERFNFGPEGYGFCVESANYDGDRWIGHPGTIPGFNTQVWRNSEKGITMVIYSNTDDGFPAQTLLIEYIRILAEL